MLLSKGYIYSIFSAVLFGSAGLFVKLASGLGIDAISLLTLQYIIAVPLMFVIMYIFNKKSFKVTKKQLLRLAILGIIGNTFMTVFYYTAYNYLPIQMVAILLYTYPIMVFIYSAVFKKGSISYIKVFAVFLAFFGCLLTLDILSSRPKYSLIGVIFALICAMFYAFMNIYSEEKLQGIGPLTINAYSTLFSLISLMIYKFPLFVFRGDITKSLLIYTIILAIFCEIIPLTLLYAAIKYIGSLKVSIIGNLEIPTAMIISFFILHEHITLMQIVGTVLVICAVYMIRTKRTSTEKL
ncbi:DMT family transporter [Clostridium estertheticum]|uniref:DMT family transporter n=1 Tax=Clostridium estertheticum TaxID=238834 RepID=UPI001C0D4CBB|nr:DMT family transporter [Clostridium estertheticum]MBU3073277.1 DMT family transporter [Clostridium estertheticum]MBU3163482.1 DMT family transporter [Clostridium estertheticum]MBU3173219.1 DMT family transporter [Clostridium estertheticum]